MNDPQPWLVLADGIGVLDHGKAVVPQIGALAPEVVTPQLAVAHLEGNGFSILAGVAVGDILDCETNQVCRQGWLGRHGREPCKNRNRY